MRICSTCRNSYSDELEYCPKDKTRLPPPVETTQVELSLGLTGRYKLLRRLGEGGMGTVFLAEQVTVGHRPVALKVLRRRLLEDEEFLQRFRAEAASAGRIGHQNIVTIYESGQTTDGSPYIAMEYLEGETLRELLNRKGRLPLEEVSRILSQAARGLQAAHKLDITHRDLKPDNIFLTRDNDDQPLVKIVDFGIAKMQESAVNTMTGMFIGTPAYMSVEQFNGMPSKEIDGRSDIYSLGVVVYEMITGCLPFEANSLITYADKHRSEPPLPLDNRCPGLRVPPGIRDVVMKALSKKREDRFATASEFAREFREAIPKEKSEYPATVLKKVPLARETAQPKVKVPKAAVRQRRSLRMIGAGVGVILLTLAGVFIFVQWLDRKRQLSMALAEPITKPAPTVEPAAAAAPARVAGIGRKNAIDGLYYVWILAGSYLMGCSAGDGQCYPDERPAHQVKISNGFWMGQTAVTVAAWKRYRLAKNTRALPTGSHGNLNEAGADDKPAVMMTWDEASSYCRWSHLRLPTEAEWEYAARADSMEARYGDLDLIAWNGHNSGGSAHPVAQKPPNAWKLYDMLGNVWQWTADWYDADYYKRRDSEDPKGPLTGSERVLRGGSWWDGSKTVRLSSRLPSNPDERLQVYGCRCVGDLP